MTQDKTHQTHDQTRDDLGAEPGGPASGPLSLEFDAAEFAHFLEGTDWSEEEKAAYITLVWNIVCEFVALGFGVHPVQQAQNTCGKTPDSCGESASSGAGVVDSSHGELIEKFMRLNGSKPGSGAEGVVDE